MYIRDWFKPIFPLLTWLLRKVPNTCSQFQHLPPTPCYWPSYTYPYFYKIDLQQKKKPIFEHKPCYLANQFTAVTKHSHVMNKRIKIRPTQITLLHYKISLIVNIKINEICKIWFGMFQVFGEDVLTSFENLTVLNRDEFQITFLVVIDLDIINIARTCTRISKGSKCHVFHTTIPVM
jgi:hypothetical protein